MFGDYSHLPREECFQECQYDANLCVNSWNIDQGICRTYYRRCTYNCVNPPESFEEERPQEEGERKQVRIIEEDGQLYIVEE